MDDVALAKNLGVLFLYLFIQAVTMTVLAYFGCKKTGRWDGGWGVFFWMPIPLWSVCFLIYLGWLFL